MRGSPPRSPRGHVETKERFWMKPDGGGWTEGPNDPQPSRTWTWSDAEASGPSSGAPAWSVGRTVVPAPGATCSLWLSLSAAGINVLRSSQPFGGLSDEAPDKQHSQSMLSQSGDQLSSALTWAMDASTGPALHNRLNKHKTLR